VLVTITTTYPGATIIFTLDGTDPVCGSNGFTYLAPFNLNQSAVVKARSCHADVQSAIASAIINIDGQYCAAYCGDGELDPGEQCDDGNNVNGDGCDSNCLIESCIPAPEICDGLDNDCDGMIDNNVYKDMATSSPPALAKLDCSTNVTGKVAKSDNLYAAQAVQGTKYIYLSWHFNDLPAGLELSLAKLTLEHREIKVNMAVEWYNGANWIAVCDPAESMADKTDTCDLKSFISTTDKAQDVKIRLKLTTTGFSVQKSKRKKRSRKK
jgi:cysteine-rich repeat protein